MRGARDSHQRRELLYWLHHTLDSGLEHAARLDAWAPGQLDLLDLRIYMRSWLAGRQRGREEAFAHVYGDRPADVVARSRARRTAKGARKRNQRAKR